MHANMARRCSSMYTCHDKVVPCGAQSILMYHDQVEYFINDIFKSQSLLIGLNGHFFQVKIFFYIYCVGLVGYYVVYKPIKLPCISFMFIEMKFIHFHSYVMFAMNSMRICND